MNTKRLLIIIISLLVAMPTLAQSGDVSTYEFETGTSLDYPSDWDAQLDDGILSIGDGSQSQVLVLDYPLVNTLAQNSDLITRQFAVEALTAILIEQEIDAEEVYEFTLNERLISAYDIEFALSGGVYAVEFSNGAIGMLVTIEVNEDIETSILASFDSTEAVITNFAMPSSRNNEPQSEPTAYLLPTDQRFFVPAGWVLDLQQLDDLQYAIVSLPDSDIEVKLIDLSEIVTKGTELVEVVDTVSFDWASDFAAEINSDAEIYALGDREAIRYEATIDSEDGYVVLLRYADDAIGAVIVSGNASDEADLAIRQLIGSFNNLGAVLSYLQ